MLLMVLVALEPCAIDRDGLRIRRIAGRDDTDRHLPDPRATAARCRERRVDRGDAPLFVAARNENGECQASEHPTAARHGAPPTVYLNQRYASTAAWAIEKRGIEAREPGGARDIP